jgi:hypothetical protein
LALEENPFEIIKRNLAWSKRSFGNNEEEDAGEKFEMWKRKLLQISQSQNPLKLMILMKT